MILEFILPMLPLFVSCGTPELPLRIGKFWSPKPFGGFRFETMNLLISSLVIFPEFSSKICKSQLPKAGLLRKYELSYGGGLELGQRLNPPFFFANIGCESDMASILGLLVTPLLWNLRLGS